MVNTISIWTARGLRIVSRACCLLVIASFAIFAVSQSSSASAHQQAAVNESAPASSAPAAASPTSGAHHDAALHRWIDEGARQLISPFSGISHGWSSAWAVHLANLALALALYGFGLGYLARVLRVRSRTPLLD
ncbi:MAG TPA: hypothetical protein VGX16_02805 [Solirubrobacteraceae bacterium]|jgi:hypothetical protein|nr:hypothetical protein [Solirubrobacteraceae bacterium]